MAVLRKKGTSAAPAMLPGAARKYAASHRLIHVLSDATPVFEVKGKEKIPSAAYALSLDLPANAYPRAELSLQEAKRYLHRESLVLPPDTPKGFVVVTYQHHPLGFVKNVGDRANNLYPKNWAVRKL